MNEITCMSELVEAFEAMLDEIAEPLFGFPPSEILRKMDPWTFRNELDSYAKAMEIDTDSLWDDIDWWDVSPILADD